MPLFEVIINSTVTVPNVEAATQAEADALVKQDVLTRYDINCTVTADVPTKVGR